MKKIFFMILVFTVFSCDKIETPLPEAYGEFNWDLYPFEPSTYPYDISNPANNWGPNSNKKGILLEDYTGHKCTNCPSAATIAKDLEEDTSLNVIVASIHASADGSFQSTDNLFTNNYRTEAGDTYVSQMSGFIGNPLGTINRNDGGFTGTVWYFPTNWTNGVSNELNNSLNTNIQLQYNYYVETNGLYVHTETSFLNTITGNYHLVIYLVRNDVVSAQKFNGGITDTSYHHHAILSDNINGTWGSLLIDSIATEDSIIYNDFSYELPDPLIDSTYRIDNLSLITYLFNRDTYRIEQAIKTDLEN